VFVVGAGLDRVQDGPDDIEAVGLRDLSGGDPVAVSGCSNAAQNTSSGAYSPVSTAVTPISSSIMTVVSSSPSTSRTLSPSALFSAPLVNDEVVVTGPTW
jgi:hypothetical protein